MATQTSGNVGGINFGIGTYTDNASITSTFASLQKKIEDQAKSFTIGPEMERAALIQAGREEQSKKEFGYIRERIEANEREFQQWYQLEQQREAIAEAAFQKWYQLELRKEEIRERISHPRIEQDNEAENYRLLKQRLAAEEAAGEQRIARAALERQSLDAFNADITTHQASLRTAEEERLDGIYNATRALEAQRETAIRGIEEASAAEQRRNAQWLTMQAARRNADPYAAGGKSPFMSTADAIQERAAREQAEHTATIIGRVRQQQYEVEGRNRAEAENRAQQIIATVRTQQMRVLRQADRDEIAMRLNGIDLVAARETTLHQQRMNQLLSGEGSIRGAVGGRSAAQIAMEANNASAALAHASGKRGMMLQEAGRGFEDFFTSFSMGKTTTDGIAMGLRGAANNAAQLASYINPTTGAFVAIGAALSTVIVPMMVRWLTNEKELTDVQKKRMDAQIAMQGQLAEMKFSEDPAKERINEGKQQKIALDRMRRIQELMANEPPVETTATERFFGAGGAKDSPRMKLLRAEYDRLAEETIIREEMLGQSRIENQKRAWEKEQNAKEMQEWEDENQWNAYVKEKQDRERQEEIKAIDEKFKFMQAAEKAHLDGQIETQQASVDELQERIQKAGNAAGPSSAMMRGTQAAEQVISRAIAGTRSQEDVMKAQLKVQQDMLKQLQNKKNAPIATI